jgi:hypothetical protein
MRPIFAILLSMIAAAACGPAKSPPPVSNPPPPVPDAAPAKVDPAPRMIDGRYYVEAGAPDPLACQVDKDCIGDTVTDEGGCCIASPAPYPQTWPWHTWLSNRRMSATCKAVTCPPLPIPTEPPKCAFDVHCQAGKCVNSCP